MSFKHRTKFKLRETNAMMNNAGKWVSHANKQSHN